MTKVCPGCHRDLPLAAYHKNKSRPAGINPRCKECENSADRKRRAGKKPVVFEPPRTGASKYRHDTVESFEEFFNAFSGHILPEHAKAWVAAALANPHLLLNVPPRHAKTTIMATWFPIWRLALNRDTQILVVSKTASGTVENIATGIATQLEHNRRLNDEFGRFRPLDSTRRWRVAQGELEVEGKNLDTRPGGLSLQIRGAQQQILGMEADWVIADDITDQRVAASLSESKKEWNWFLGEVLTRLSPKGRAFCIGQRVHGNDIYGRLAAMGGDDGEFSWHLEKTPAIIDYPTEKVLWPEEWPFKVLSKKKKTIGTPLFNCMYQQAPEVAGDFVPEAFIYGGPVTPGCLDLDRVLGEGWVSDDNMVAVTRVVSIDPSPTRYAALITADVIYQTQAEEFWCNIVDIRRERMGQRVMLENIQDISNKLHPSAIIFESNSIKWLHEDVLWNQILRLFRTTVDHKTGGNKNDQLMGVWSLAADLEAGRVRFPYGDEASRTASHFLIDEILSYPNGRTDDVLMALWFIKYSYRQLVPYGLQRGHFDGSQRGGWNMRRMRTEGAWARA